MRINPVEWSCYTPMVCPSNCYNDWSPASKILDMLRWSSLNASAWCGETGSQGELSRHNGNWPRWSRDCSVNHWQSNTREKSCRTPKHFVWSALGAGREAKCSVCGIYGESSLSRLLKTQIAKLKWKWDRLNAYSANGHSFRSYSNKIACIYCKKKYMTQMHRQCFALY